MLKKATAKFGLGDSSTVTRVMQEHDTVVNTLKDKVAELEALNRELSQKQVQKLKIVASDRPSHDLQLQSVV